MKRDPDVCPCGYPVADHDEDHPPIQPITAGWVVRMLAATAAVSFVAVTLLVGTLWSISTLASLLGWGR